jgi:predicted TIM-barrel fold metal-dependent hydrolase
LRLLQQLQRRDQPLLGFSKVDAERKRRQQAGLARGPAARSVAVIDDKASESELDAMLLQAGFRGIRLNLATVGISDPSVGRVRFQTAVDRMKTRGWHVQLFTSLAVISAI